MSEEAKDKNPNKDVEKMKVVENNSEESELFKPGQVFQPGEAPDILVDDFSEVDSNVLKLYEKSFERVHEGDIIKGTVVALTDKDVVVDVGFKSEGMIPKDEFIDIETIKVGDQVEVFLENPEDLEGQVLLSRRKVYFLRTWEDLIRKHEQSEVIKGKITRRIKGGFVVDLGGVDAFLPGSQVDVKPIRDFDAFVGQDLDLKIVKVNEQRKNIVVSRRVIIEKTLESKREKIIETLQKGQVRRGMVKNITDFGVFIDLGGVDGLLHITDLSWGRVNHPSEVVKLDQEIDIMILDFDENKSRISLGLKQLQPHPWENVEERFPIGSKVKGKVVSITDYGAFIELEKGIEGLIHVSEMSWSQHIKNPSQLLKEGDEVEAVVLSIEADDRKISLGLKQLFPDPWENIEKKYPINSKHRGIVRNLTPFGAFVELEEGVDGLVHISDLSWTKKVRHPSEVVKKNQEIDVVVLDINKDERRIALGHKQVEANPWDTFEESYNVGIETKGTISRLIDKGVIVTLPLGVEEIDSYMTTHNFTPTTMGELVKDVPEVLEGLPDEEYKKERPARKPKSKKVASSKEAEKEVIEETAHEKVESVSTKKEEREIRKKQKTVEKIDKPSEPIILKVAEGKSKVGKIKEELKKSESEKEGEDNLDTIKKKASPKKGKKSSEKDKKKSEKAVEDNGGSSRKTQKRGKKS